MIKNKIVCISIISLTILLLSCTFNSNIKSTATNYSHVSCEDLKELIRFCNVDMAREYYDADGLLTGCNVYDIERAENAYNNSCGIYPK